MLEHGESLLKKMKIFLSDLPSLMIPESDQWDYNELVLRVFLILPECVKYRDFLLSWWLFVLEFTFCIYMLKRNRLNHSAAAFLLHLR